MMETKPTTSLRDRRLSPSPSPLQLASRPARPSPKTSLSYGDNTSPLAAKKSVPNYLKPKAAPSSESPTRRISTVPTITASATSKTPSARRLTDKVSSASTPALQRSLKPTSPTPRPSSSSRLNGDKAVQTVSRTARTSPVPKAKSTSPTPVKKKEAPVTIASTSPQVKLSSDHEAVAAFEKPVQEQLWSNPTKVVEASNELKNVEESKSISSLIEEENHIEEQKCGEPENWEEVLVPQVFVEVTKEPVVFEEVPDQAGVAMASTPMEKRDDGKKVEHIEVIVRRVDPEVRKLRLGAAVDTVVTAMPGVKKDALRSNDVIEETKSKLMGTRKNRVLALVGAFETVISLQELEDQQIQKAHLVQHGQQIQQGQQVEQSFENQKSQQGAESQQNQEVQEAQNAQQLEGGNEVHQDQQGQENVEHHDKGKEEDNAMLKEQGNESLEKGEEGEDEKLKEEEADEALESKEEGEDALVKAEEVEEALHNGELGEDAMLKEEQADKALQTSSKAEEESRE